MGTLNNKQRVTRMPDSICNLSDLLSVRDTVAQYPSIYPSENSLRWDIFNNREEMTRQGVLVRRGRRVLINRRKLAERLIGSANLAG